MYSTILRPDHQCLNLQTDDYMPAGGPGDQSARQTVGQSPPWKRYGDGSRLILGPNKTSYRLLSSLFDLLHCRTPQTRAECCLGLTAVSGYGMFLGPFR